jgi:hypothetical protein
MLRMPTLQVQCNFLKCFFFFLVDFCTILCILIFIFLSWWWCGFVYSDAYIGQFDIRNLCKNPTLKGENPTTGADTRLSANCND